MELNDINSVYIHWTESKLINSNLGCDENSDIENYCDVNKLDNLIKYAAREVVSGYDKIVLTVYLKNDEELCDMSKFYITKNTKGLLNLKNRG